MTENKLRELIDKGEGIEVEFKTSRSALNKDVFETICAFLNRNGGHLILGVNDNGHITGVEESKIRSINKSLVDNANNPQKLNPPFYLSTQVIKTTEGSVIYVYVPQSSLVHSTVGRIFDRNDDGDMDVTRHTDQVSRLYSRKQTTYSENQIFPYVSLSDLNPQAVSYTHLRAHET